MSPVPGQRAAQRPRVAAVASARATGRALAPGGGLAGDIGLTLRGRRVRIYVDESTGLEVLQDAATGRVFQHAPTADELDALETEGES